MHLVKLLPSLWTLPLEETSTCVFHSITIRHPETYITCNIEKSSDIVCIVRFDFQVFHSQMPAEITLIACAICVAVSEQLYCWAKNELISVHILPTDPHSLGQATPAPRWNHKLLRCRVFQFFFCLEYWVFSPPFFPFQLVYLLSIMPFITLPCSFHTFLSLSVLLAHSF